jgi:hypothetical protein
MHPAGDPSVGVEQAAAAAGAAAAAAIQAPGTAPASYEPAPYNPLASL